MAKELETKIGRQILGRKAGKHLPQRCTILQKLAKEKDGARAKEEEKEKETKEKEKDSKATVTSVTSGDTQRRIAQKEKQKEKENSGKDSKEKEKDSKATAGTADPKVTPQPIARKAKEKAKEEKACTPLRSQAKSLERTGERQRGTIAGMKRQNWSKQKEQLTA